MSVIYVAMGSIAIGLILVGILSNLGGPINRCGMVMAKKRRYNVCVKISGHPGKHICADGKEF
mgnify:CR=1 FL=1|jgi:hypothetical protein